MAHFPLDLIQITFTPNNQPPHGGFFMPMSVLLKPKYEIFAQEVAKGKTKEAAYSKAYPNAAKDSARKNATRLMTNYDILRRIDDIQQKAAQKCGVTVVNITQKLLEIAREAHSQRSTAALNVARNAYMDAAKLNGLISNKQETTLKVIDISDTPIDDDEWERKYTKGDNLETPSGSSESPD